MLSSQDSLSKSPFNAWITSNYAPTDWERQQIKTYLVPVVESSLALDAAIQDARRTLESLLEDKATIDATISAHEAILRPIRRLPPDILREIFAQCLPVDQPPTMESDKAPLTLTRVCRSWREIALSSPELWRHIHITAPQGPDAYLKFHQERIERWVRAAGNMPVSVSVWIEMLSEQPFESTLDVILAHSHRIGTLDLDVSDRFLQEFDDRQTAETWPLLESVTICWAGWTSNEPDISSLKIWNAPMLKSVKLIAVDVEVLSLPVKWTQLQSISLPLVERDLYDNEIGVAARETLLTHEMARLLLESAPLLSSLHVSIADEDRPMPAAHPVPSSLNAPCVQAHLTILYLDDVSVHSDSNAPALLDNLQLPSLRTLHYHLDSSQNGETSFAPLPPSNMNPVYRFLVSQAQPCSITCWRITRHSMQHSAFINCLKLMPALERLYVEDEQLQDLGFVPQVVDPYVAIYPDDSLLDLLVQRSDETLSGPPSDPTIEGRYLCPKLTSIRLDSTIFTVDAVKAFLACRSELSAQRDGHSRSAAVRRLYLGVPCPDADHEEPTSGGQEWSEKVEKELRSTFKIDLTVKLVGQGPPRFKFVTLAPPARPKISYDPWMGLDEWEFREDDEDDLEWA
ncbi:hypothetical protein DFP72DRAFT_892951 [Ephemerocybe angulata]|uniref:F-box domain-containing protein n=1 Tax=Ephemerocybe angulata TaxID=980116 RepID=A0A8H6M6V2_9AGAR|nr:hypothetical protein DFP72DRAFT_892951 [Tulosesus angulatus]